MKLTELFPELSTLKLGNEEYELKYTVRSKLQFEKDYPEIIVEGQEISTEVQVINAINSILKNLKTSDIVNFLYAGLIHTKKFNDKETLIDLMETNKIVTYIDNIICAYELSTYTDEQIEKLQVMAKVNGSKKKAEVEITQANTHSLEQKLD